jgi:hypothetical protein
MRYGMVMRSSYFVVITYSFIIFLISKTLEYIKKVKLWSVFVVDFRLYGMMMSILFLYNQFNLTEVHS